MKRKRSILSLILSLIMIILQFSGISVKAVEKNYENPVVDKYNLMDVKRTVGVKEVGAGDTFDVKYTIMPKPIEVKNVSKDKPKDIVMVIDDSGSMRYIPGQRREPYYYHGEKSRLEIMKEVSKKFINEFNDNDNARISLVRYSNMAKAIAEFKEVNKDNKVLLNRTIENLQAEGSTNTGDGFRVAYGMLKKENNDHDKYIVFMTDGEAEAYSWNYRYRREQYYTGEDIEYNSNYKVNKTLWNTGYNGWYYYNYANPDYRYKSLQYAKIMANKVAEHGTEDNKIKTFVVGFSKDAGSNNKEIADEANGTYYKAEDENTINNIYESIQKIIQTNVSGKLHVEECFSSNLQVESCPKGFKVDNNRLIGNIDNVYYTLSEDGKYYQAEPVEFSVKYKVTENADVYLGKDNDSFVKMDVLDKSETKNLEECKIISINSTIVNQGIFKGFGQTKNYIHPVKVTKVADTMPINLAMEVDVKTSKSELDLKIQGNIKNDTFKFKKYEIKNGSIDLNTCEEKDFNNAKEFKFTNSDKFKLEKGKKYIITYVLLPKGKKDEVINIETSADKEKEKKMDFKIDDLPNLF